MFKKSAWTIIRKDKNAISPSRGHHQSDAGHDLFPLYNFTIKAHETIVVPTGLIMDIPQGYYVAIVGRSGLSSKGIILSNGPGTIDETYTGDIGIILTNTTDHEYNHENRKAVAQAILMKNNTNNVVIITDFEHMNKEVANSVWNKGNHRGEQGYGSSDTK